MLAGLPTVGVVAWDGDAGEPARPGFFMFTRSGGDGAAVTVPYLVGGTATHGVDYRHLSGQVTIPGGGTSGDVDFLQLPDETLRVGIQPVAFHEGDFNRDGSLDLAVVSHQAVPGLLTIHLGNGWGGFEEPNYYSTAGVSPRSLDVADFNRDGLLDIVVANRNSSDVAVFLGNGAGGFPAAPVLYGVGSNPRAIKAADFDKDGRIDFVTANAIGSSVTLWRGDGGGGFTARAEFSTVLPGKTSFPRSLVVEDFNLDGHLDVAVSSSSGENVSMLLGDGAGSFAPPTSIAWGPGHDYSLNLISKDLDLDGDVDLVTANHFGSSLSVLLNQQRETGRFSFAAPQHVDLGDGLFEPRYVTTGDFNSDGIPDLAVADSVELRVGILLGDGRGAFGRREDVRLSSGGPLGDPLLTASLAVSDFDQDGDSDLVAVSGWESFAVLLNQSQAASSALVRVDVIADAENEELETVEVTIPGNPSYLIDPEFSDATVTISSTDLLPLIEIVTSDAIAGEPDNDGEFTIRRSGDTSRPLTVRFHVTGTATPGTDYQQIGTSVEIPAGLDAVALPIIVLDDGQAEVSETVVVTLASDPASAIAVTPRATLVISGDEQLPIPVAGLLAHWALDETGGSMAADSSGNDHHGAVDGAVWTPATRSGGLEFDGIRDSVDAGTGPAIVGTGGFSVSAWVRTSSPTDQVIVQQRSPAGYNGEYVLQTLPSGHVHFWTVGGFTAGPRVTSAQPIHDGQWHHVTGVREDDGTMRLYIDGLQAGNAPGSPRPLVALGVYLGADKRDNKYFFNGTLDEVRIYNRALLPAEVIALAGPSIIPIDAMNDLYTGDEDAPLSVPAPGLLLNDRGNGLVVSAVSSTSTLGLPLTAGVDGSFVYDPSDQFEHLSAGQSIIDTFTYSITDDSDLDTATVTITVQGRNDPPTANPDTASTSKNTAVSIDVVANDRDPDQLDALTLVSVDTVGVTGRITFAGGTLTYDPRGKFDHLVDGQSATDTFTYTVRDGSQATATGQITVTIHGRSVNDPPRAMDDQYALAGGTILRVPPAGLLANDTDADGVITASGFWYAAPDGSPSGDGSPQSPWDLTTLFAHPPQLEPGDTVFLRGGTYFGAPDSTVSGTASLPILIRSYPGEHAVIDTYAPATFGEDRIIGMFGDHVHWMNLEFMSSDPRPRVTNIRASGYPDINRGTLSVKGSHNKFINIVAHDLDTGIGFWAEGTGGEIYNALIYNNGWIGPDRQHGHGIYVHNELGTKRIADSIIFNQFGMGFHAFGSELAFLQGLDVEGNVIFNSGGGSGQGFYPERDILIGGGRPASDIRVANNFTYQNDKNGLVGFGFLTGPDNQDIEILDNSFVGRVSFHSDWKDVTYRGNTNFAPADVLIELGLTAGATPADYRWDQNDYYSTFGLQFRYEGASYRYPDWRVVTGFDAESTFTPSAPSGVEVFVRPNQYEAGRGNVIVYNWALESSVQVDLSSLLQAGQAYEVRSAVDVHGPPLLTGIYDGGPVSLPMGTVTPPSPISYAARPPAAIGPEFGVFVVTSPSNPWAGLGLVVSSHDATSALGGSVSMDPKGGFVYDASGIAALERLGPNDQLQDTFSYTVSDQAGGSDTATVTITITGRNHPPTANDDNASTSEDSAIDIRVLNNDSDIDRGDSIRVQSVAGAATAGLVRLNPDQTIHYDPRGVLDRLPAGSTFVDSFRYTIVDQFGETSTAGVTVTINGVNDPPVLRADTATTDARSEVTIDVLAGDRDPDNGDVLRVVSLDGSLTIGTVTLSAGVVTYDPSGRFNSLAAGQTATDRFVYRVSDKAGAVVSAEVVVTIRGVDAPPAPVDGLMAHWPLDDGLGTTAADVSGRGIQGRLFGNPTWSSGKLQGGLAFDGSGDHIDAGLGAAVVGKGGFAVAAWVRSSASRDQVVIQQRSAKDYNGQYMLHLTPSGQVRFWTFGGTIYGPIAVTPKPINDGEWHHVVGVRENDGTTRIYVDGQLHASVAGAPRALVPIQVYVGADMRNQSRFFDGSLDDVRIYNRSLSANEVTNLAAYRGGAVIQPPVAAVPAIAPLTAPSASRLGQPGAPASVATASATRLIADFALPAAIAPPATIHGRAADAAFQDARFLAELSLRGESRKLSEGIEMLSSARRGGL